MALVPGAGSSWQHNKLGSVGMVSDLTFAGFNNFDFYLGETRVRSVDAFVIDSIRFYGYYGFNPARAYVDTLRVTFCYAPATADTQAIFPVSTTDPALLLRYGLATTDTLHSYGLHYDVTNSTAGGTTVVTKDVILDNTGPSPAWGDTVYGVHEIGVRLSPSGITVPAGSLIGASITFLSGDPGFVAHDTLETSFGHYKYSVFRPFCLYKNVPTGPMTYSPVFPTYQSTDRNNGVFKTLPDGSDGWDGQYTPQWYLSGASGAATDWQYPAIDFHLASCASCPPVVETTEVLANSHSNELSMLPNPATNEVWFQLPSLWQGNVEVSIFDCTGRRLVAETVGVQNNRGHCATATLPSGVYLYQIKAGSNQYSGKLSVIR
jgi:hypothetical protein